MNSLSFCASEKVFISSYFFLRFYLFLFLQRVEGREKEKERNIDVQEIHRSVASHMDPTGDLAHNPGTCPDQELNQETPGSQVATQSTEPHQPGPPYIFFKDFIYLFLEKGEGREKERERNINMWLPLICPHWGPRLQPRACALTPCFTGECSIH